MNDYNVNGLRRVSALFENIALSSLKDFLNNLNLSNTSINYTFMLLANAIMHICYRISNKITQAVSFIISHDSFNKC